MEENKMLSFIKEVLDKMPNDWLRLTTHRLDIYNEKLAKTEFLARFEIMFESENVDADLLSELPTAFDYIRLGHPLSCILEWVIAKMNNTSAANVISFSSRTMAILAVLRKNALAGYKTRILYSSSLPDAFDLRTLREVYNYDFELQELDAVESIGTFDGSTILFSEQEDVSYIDRNSNIDFYVNSHPAWGSVIIVEGPDPDAYVAEIQHVRRRESIAMTPADALEALKTFVGGEPVGSINGIKTNKEKVLSALKVVSGVDTNALLGNCGLSIQYAIMMGLIEDAHVNHPGKAIKIMVPPNCYGGTNDQARRVASCVDNVEIVDLPVDAGRDMVQSIDNVLAKVASEDGVPYIIAEIPTNPRVEVPELIALRDVLSKERKTANGDLAIDPVFILDQTFCPNVHFLGDGKILSEVRSIAYVSGSKFPSGGLCTAGYCMGNQRSMTLLDYVEKHLNLCDNVATPLQVEILATQMPSMTQRIQGAYRNTREFVDFINEKLPAAKINFVSRTLADEGFTPSVFSLDLPTRGETTEEKESYKRELNYKLINLMINQLPDEAKFCVSYGQLKGSYWTIPATSTQGTTKEGDKDYIVRVSLSPEMDIERHKQVFLEFVEQV